MQPISFTFAGRRHFLKILVPYLLREREASGLKKHVWYLHTNNHDDLAYIHEVTQKYPDFFEILDTGIRPNHTTFFYNKAYKHFNDPDQIYIKLDDDIVFIEKGALGRLCAFKQANPNYFMVFANIVNNGICAHLHQKFGALRAPDLFWWKQDNNTDIMRTSATGPASMVRIHESFFENYSEGKLDRYKFYQWILWERLWFSINAFAVQGSDLAFVKDKLDDCGPSDERFLTEEATKILDKDCCIYGDALVSHYSFRMQSSALDHREDLIARYAEICTKETGAHAQ